MTSAPTPDYRDRMRACAEAIGLDAPSIVLPTDDRVTLGTLRFHYLDWGNTHLPHLVLLHGGGLTAHTWDMAALLLRDRYHLVAPDLRGHGDTDWMAEDDLQCDLTDWMVSDVARFLEFLDLDRVALAGMSFGGVAAMRYAEAHPERVSALVLVDVGPESMREGGQATQQFHRETDVLDRFEDFVERAMRFNPLRKREHIEYSLTHSLKQTSQGWTWKQDPRPRDLGALVPEETRLANNERRAAELWAVIRAITTPTLVLRGQHTRSLSPEVAVRLAEEMPDARLVTVPDSTGYIPGDRPKEFAREVDAFLSRVR
ncbi:MAG: alpha/beta hydrolase [Chloroflexi bacterium]|nr:alpha/beta hydrolase [Chloroflexota bacterium]